MLRAPAGRRTTDITTQTIPQPPQTHWAPIQQRFLSAILDRAFADLAATLDADVRMRALVPPGPFELIGAAAVTAQFEHWFGGGHEFTVCSHGMELSMPRARLHWTVQRRGAAKDPLLTAEQRCLVTATDRITTIDLMCTGWAEVAA